MDITKLILIVISSIALSITLATIFWYSTAKASHVSPERIHIATFFALMLCSASWPIISQRYLVGYRAELNSGVEQIGYGLWLNRSANLLLVLTFIVINAII